MTGKVRALNVPASLEDLCFDLDGYACLRGYHHVLRYDPANWREVPWDDGEEVQPGGAHWISALPVPGGTCGAGLGVSPAGHLAVTHETSGRMMDNLTAVNANKWGLIDAGRMDRGAAKPYEYPIYPGRVQGKRSVLVHIFDRHGKVAVEDAIPGFGLATGGLRIDRDGGLYKIAGDRRLIAGKPLMSASATPDSEVLDSQFAQTGTLIKFRPKQGRLLARGGPVPLPEEALPRRPQDIEGRWAEGAE